MQYDDAAVPDYFAVFFASLPPSPSPCKVFHPLRGEHLTTGTVATVTWTANEEMTTAEESVGMEGIDLWLVAVGGEEALIAQGIDATCAVRSRLSCATTTF